MELFGTKPKLYRIKPERGHAEEETMRRFSAEEWRGLRIEERIRQCRFMADEADKLANGSESHIKAGFEKLAQQWRDLADEMEAESARR